MTDGLHDAADSALGYLFQTQWPLIELIRRSRESPDCQLTLELLDDVLFMDDGSPKELIQSKHHAQRNAGLGDMSVDVWRTLNVWIDVHHTNASASTSFTLLTTTEASAESAAWFLSRDHRDPETAQRLLEVAARDSTNDETASARQKFLSLNRAARTDLVSRIRVLDGAVHVEDLDAELQRELYLVTPQGQESTFVGLVWDWWYRRALMLLQRTVPFVTGLELKAAIDTIRDGFSDGNLPTMAPIEEIDQEQIQELHTRMFVHQMALVAAPSVVLEKAIQDYYRAVAQSAAWIENNLVDLPEVSKFKVELRDEWEREFAWAVDALPADPTEDEKRNAGRELLKRCLATTQVHIRPRYQEAFYFRGKLHELADERLIGWHPEFEVLLDALLEGVNA